jgi:ribosome-binding ATPase
MNLSVGIVGLPNAGKSTLFNALLKKQVAFAANYPFATIEPNVGIVPVPDERLSVIEKIVNTQKIVPATVKFVDIAGLVAGASKGEGLGNKFLAHIREVDLICHVLRSFTDPSVVHVAGDVDWKRDKEIVETELILADLQTLEKQTAPRMNATKEDLKRWELIKILIEGLSKGKTATEIITDEDDRNVISQLQLMTAKPVLYVFNVGEDQIKNSEILKQVQDDNKVSISAQIESELASLSEDEQKAYLKELGLEKSGLERLIQKAYEKLGLISFLTGGELEARAWTITKGTLAPQAAAVIHTDFEKHFIKADIVPFPQFVELNGWSKAREVGKVQTVGKEYEMKDGDVVEFKIGT